MLRIEDYYTDAPSAGIITMLERPEVVNRLLNILICNFSGFNYTKLKVNMYSVQEELEEYRNMHQEYLSQIQMLHAYYDGHQLALKRILKDINYDTHLNTKVYSPVIGCPIGCKYCFTKCVVDHFGITEDYKKQIFRGFYKMTKDEEGNDIPELFNIENENPIDWFLTYMSDFGCWKPEWQENVLQQIIAASNIKRRQRRFVDTFQLVTKRPSGIDLSPIPVDTDMRNVIISCTVDRNACTGRITDLIEKTKDYRITACVVYQPVLEYIEPVHLDELVNTFGKDYTWVIIGGEVGGANPLRFEWIKDLIDKCIELGIPLKIERDIMKTVLESGYEFMEQSPKLLREAKAIRVRNLELKKGAVAEYYEVKIAELNDELKRCAPADRLDIAASILYGEVEIIAENAKRLLERMPEFDLIFSAETKGTPLAYELSRQSGKDCIIAHKSVKLYMEDTLEVSVKSLLSEKKKKFYLSAEEARAFDGKRVLIVDNVISTPESLRDLEVIVERLGGTPIANAAIFTEEGNIKRDDTFFIAPLPVQEYA
ncbi:Adenine/guanine phosphoribosyltransferase [Ruminococcus flavefaciens]|uniref:Adenine/guanine phosphoribosyltransferase n=1 Tax=Ruminococcus flavefaciens TaxID=1265 RepID=A0A1H6I215_RUMFL|nr:DUF5131 family protein [Ruminococcus flavefaciens]SEH42815.1 Adenine/guanine phosphoribosyltransferase [Ruminococcus flavefaciens]